MESKVAVVTGGTKGIGKQVVFDLLVRGFRVWTTFHSDVEVAMLAKAEFEERGRCLVLQANEKDLVQALSVEERIDVVVGNAGCTLRKSFSEITDEDWNGVFRVNVTENFALVRDLYPKLSDNARIVFIGSMMGRFPHGTSLPYGVSKAALHALAQNLVKEFEGTGTTVNAIAPGFVETEWQRTKPEEIRQNIYRKTAVKRFADVREISSAVMFCIDNAFVNGTVLDVSGGYCFK